MKKLLKLVTLIASVCTLGACSDEEEKVYNYTGEYALTYNVGGDEEFNEFLKFGDFSSKEDVANFVHRSLISYSDKSLTPDSAIHFKTENPFTVKLIDGGEIEANNVNEHRIDEYTVEVGFFYGAVNGVYHLMRTSNDYAVRHTYFTKASTISTLSSAKTCYATMVDSSLIFEESSLVVNVKGEYLINDQAVVGFNLALTYKK